MKKLLLIHLIVALAIVATSCLQNTSQKKEENLKPGQSLGIASVPNLRDVGGYITKEGKIVARGLLFRSNHLNPISTEDMKKISALGLKNDFDLRTKDEVAKHPDEIPSGVKYTLLNVLADANQSSAAMLGKLLHDQKRLISSWVEVG